LYGNRVIESNLAEFGDLVDSLEHHRFILEDGYSSSSKQSRRNGNIIPFNTHDMDIFEKIKDIRKIIAFLYVLAETCNDCQ
jgi:hypothetical protein